jgi:hypothetical protein
MISLLLASMALPQFGQSAALTTILTKGKLVGQGSDG